MPVKRKRPVPGRNAPRDLASGGGRDQNAPPFADVAVLPAVAVVLRPGGGRRSPTMAYDEYRVIRLARTVRQAFAARRIEEAREPLRRWLAMRPGSGEAFYYQAWAAMAADQPGEAIQAIERARKAWLRPCPTRLPRGDRSITIGSIQGSRAGPGAGFSQSSSSPGTWSPRS